MAIIFGTSSGDLLKGTPDDDEIHGEGGSDTLYGGDGNDVLDSGPGSEVTFIFSYGDDTFIVNDNNYRFTIRVLPADDEDYPGGIGYNTTLVLPMTYTVTSAFIGTSGMTTVYSEDFRPSAISSTTMMLVRNIVFTGSTNANASGGGDDNRIVGNAGDNILKGNGGNDSLEGHGGNDTLTGDAGNDTLTGGAGNDSLQGDDGTDTASYADAITAVTVTLATPGVQQNTVGAGLDTLSNIENLTGSAYSDTLTGDTAANVLIGDAGNDTLSGGAGNDSLQGGAGNDSLQGGAGTDTASYADASIGVTVILATPGVQQNTVGAGIDTLSNFENLTGSAYGDTLTGDTAANVLIGDAGNDTLTGGAGNDSLQGGDGIDTACFAAPAQNYTVTRTAATFNVTDKIGAEGVDTLASIERLKFTDISIAFDLDGNAGVVAKILGAVFGPTSVNNEIYAGIGLHLLDGGMSQENLAALAIQAAGASTPEAIVALLWTNVIGSPPSAEQARPFVDMLNSGTSTGSLGMLAANTDINALNIDLIGLSQTGLEYLPSV